MTYAIIQNGPSKSFPNGDAFLAGVSDNADVLIVLGAAFITDPGKQAILIELGNECLAEHVGDDGSVSYVLGFARYRNGNDAPSKLIELVRPPSATDEAAAAAIDLFTKSGFEVVVSADQIGRIIKRLVVPKYNAALRFLDEGLATQADMDLTCNSKLGIRMVPSIAFFVAAWLGISTQPTRCSRRMERQPIRRLAGPSSPISASAVEIDERDAGSSTLITGRPLSSFARSALPT